MPKPADNPAREQLRRRINNVFFMGERDGDKSCFRRGDLSITVVRSGNVIDTVDVRRDIPPSRVDLYRYQRTAPGTGVYAQALYDIDGIPAPLAYEGFLDAFNRAYEALLVYSPDGVNEALRQAQKEERPGLLSRIRKLFSRGKEPAEAAAPAPSRPRREADEGMLLIGPEPEPSGDDEFDALFRD